MLDQLHAFYNKFEKSIGSLKFAVIIISLFCVAMTVGTFVESYYGTEFAARTVYKTWPFMLLQFCMFLSILFATYQRLPPKKRLYGFYVIHTGLIMIGAGSAITYLAGVDGNIVLPPNTPARQIMLSNDVLRIEIPGEEKIFTLNLPDAAFETNIDQSWGEFKFTKFYPYSEKVFTWQPEKRAYPKSAPRHTSEYKIANDMVSEKMFLSIHPEADEAKSTLSLGPLSINYLPAPIGPCFIKNNASEVIIWNPTASECFVPEEKKISVQTTSSGNRFLAFKDEQSNRVLTFFLELSPWPLDRDMKVVSDSAYRIFSKKLFTTKPTLFVFGKYHAFYDKDEKLWGGGALEFDQPVSLPWMGFELTLLQHHDEKVPGFIPNPIIPIQKNGEIIKGGTRALLMSVRGQEYWLTNEKGLALLVDGKKAEFYLTKEALTLPFEFVLTNFKMDKDPGTNNPASYESFVRLFTSDGPTDHHVYMNNPLKFQGFTFYQASYAQDQQGNYSSTLSANVDQGRPLKYLGSLFLVLGAIWHYMLNRKRWQKRAELITSRDEPSAQETSRANA
ncbi:MAG: hypothetical protein CME71_12175 [Halobacteriovorax sp.]|nr:hypothetical protein [Halobacteriovorax sp.]